MALYAIWIECKNNSVCEDLMEEIRRLEALIGTLEPLGEG